MTLRIACSALGKRIFAGHLTKDGTRFREPRHDVTSDVLKAVIDKIEIGNEAEVSDGENIVARIAVLPPIAAPVAETAGEGVELTFGMGALVVNTGMFGGDNAVFIAKATAPGEVGAYTGNAAFKRDVMQPGEHVLIFPTAQQAQAVADALVGAVPAQDDDKLRIAVEALGKIEALAYGGKTWVIASEALATLKAEGK